MILFKRMAERHWRKYLPALTRALEAEGKFEEETTLAAQQACEELARMVARGAQLEACKEIVLKEYILLPPEEPNREE